MADLSRSARSEASPAEMLRLGDVFCACPVRIDGVAVGR